MSKSETAQIAQLDERIKSLDNNLSSLIKNVESFNEKISKADASALEGLKKEFSGLQQQYEDFNKKQSKLTKDIDDKLQGISRSRRNDSKIIEHQNKLLEYQKRLLSGDLGKKFSSLQGMMSSIDFESILQEVNSAPQRKESFTSQESLENTKKITEELKKQESQHQKNKKETKENNEELKKVEMTAQRLKNALVAAFGIHQIKSFLSNVVKMRGEFEMSEVALTNIIGNTEKAQLIWKKTMNLAVNSPLSAQQLTRYSKQLAAFRVETDKLYDTTKMLADVSVGLGVDMERLILAYGHTKSSGFLRGMYARQFATAGVNIYGELAKYYTEVEGSLVTFRDVYERISKKLVSFADVEKVFEKITSKGGTFYNMQQLLSDTVQGQINKIKDSWQQALNDIGKSSQGTIRNITNLILNIVKNWRVWLSVIEATTAAFITFKAVNITRALLSISYASNQASKSTLRLAQGLKSLFTGFKGNLPSLAIGAVVAGITAYITLKKRMDDYNKEIDNQTVTLYDAQQKMLDYQKRVEQNNAVLKDSASSEEKLKFAREDNLAVLSSLQSEYPELYAQVKQMKNGEVELTEKIEAHNESLREQIRLNELLKQKKIADDPFEKDTREYFEQLDKWRKEIIKTQQELKLKLARKEINKDEVPFVERILGIDTDNILVAVRQYNDIVASAKDMISKSEEELRKQLTDEIKALNDAWSLATNMKDRQDLTAEINRRRYKLDAMQLRSAALKEYGLENIASYQIINTDIHDTEEFAKESEKIIKELIDSFELAVRQIPEENEKINNEYESFAEYFGKNSGRLLEMVTTNTMDVNETIRTFLEKNGQALTDENKKVWNILLNQALLGEDKVKEILGLYEKAWAESDLLVRNMYLYQAKQAEGGLYDFFASFKSPSGDGDDDDKNKTYKSLDELLNLLKTMNSEYNKLSKSAYGFAKSEETVMKVFRESFKDIFKTTQGMNKLDDVLTMIKFDTLDITSKNGLAGAFQELYDFLEKNNLWTQFGKDADKLRAKLQKTIDMQEVEIGMDVQVKNREDFAKQMEDMFNDYQLTVELQGLEIDENLAKEWLDTTYTSLGDILGAANDFANGLIEKGNFDKEDLEKYKQYVDKVEAEILKTRKEKTKEYSKYLEKELSERAKTEMEYAVKVAEVQGSQIFTKDQKDAILGNMEKDYTKAMQELTWKSFKESTFYVEMMDDLSSIPADYSNMMLAKINELLMSPQVLSPRAFKEAIKARQRILEALREFKPLKARRKNKSIVDAVFSDESLGLDKRYLMGGKRRELDKSILERTKDIDNLEQEAKQYEHLTAQVEAYEKAENKANIALKNVNMTLEASEDDVQKEITAKQQQLELRKEEEDRYKQLLALQGAGGLDDAQKEELKNLAQSSIERQKEIEGLEVEIKLLNDAKQAVISYCSELDVLNKPENEDALKIINGGSVETKGGTVVSRASLASQKKENEEQIKRQSTALQKLKDAKKGTTEWARAFHEFYRQIGEMNNKVKGMGDAFYDTYEALGGETNALTEGWKEFGDTMVDVINQALQMIPTLITGFTSAGVAINSAMGIIGLIAEAIQLILVAVNAFAKLHDSGYEREIEIQQERIDELQRAYERLEKQIEKTWDTVSYIKEYREETQNLYEQYDALTKQIDAEKAKKNVDEDKLQDYEDKQQEILDNLDEIKQKQIEVFGGIGEEGYRSAAEGFVDAWKSAFLETGDGLQGLQDHFNEFLNDWFVKQATMRYASAALEPVFKMIDDAVDPNGVGGAKVVMQELEAIKEWTRDNFPQISETIEDISRAFIGEGEGSLSGLAAGIQGMTEEQANILESYWNIVRAHTDSIDVNVARIADILGAGGRSTNPQIQYLESIASNTMAIREMLSSALTNEGNGRGFRSYAL